MSTTSQTYTASDIRRWIINLAKQGKLKWSTAGMLVIYWLNKAREDFQQIKECVTCKNLITDGRYINIGIDEKEVPCCEDCVIQGAYVRIDRYLNGSAEQLDLENTREALRELIQNIKPVTPIASKAMKSKSAKSKEVKVKYLCDPSLIPK